jgi:phosphoglycolate phosphatase
LGSRRARRHLGEGGGGGASLNPLVLLFDLDGTLTDPKAGIVRCMKYALHRLGAPCPSDDVLASFIGPPLRETFATLLETSDRSVVEQALALYREEYGATGLFENHVYAGVTQMLDHVRGVASAVFVATLKPKSYADRIVRRLGLEPYFAGVYGAELGGRFDDKAELLAYLLATEQVAPERAVMIGDRAGDIVSARANRVRSIGVLWGYGSEFELADARADGLCAAPGELAACLGRLPA